MYKLGFGPLKTPPKCTSPGYLTHRKRIGAQVRAERSPARGDDVRTVEGGTRCAVHQRLGSGSVPQVAIPLALRPGSAVMGKRIRITSNWGKNSWSN